VLTEFTDYGEGSVVVYWNLRGPRNTAWRAAGWRSM